MSFVPVPNYDPSSLKGSTLILPTVSIGNVPQLVSDLLIHSLKLERIGFLDQDSLVPVSGIREDSTDVGVTVPLEVYQSKDHQWTCVQQRSPTLKGKKQEFINEIATFTSQFKQVVLLTSMDATRRLDSQINGPPFRVWGNGEYKEKAVALSVPILETTDDKLELPGSGLARHLYEQLETKVPVTLLIMFALEGDNVQDSIEYGNFINTLLNLQLTGWTPPKSWEFLFGTPFNADLYQ
ncbi:PAC2 family-domain-containing protein [Helicostylum pulchrum]|nr:PAC2 family-domain-containing protein [Helicostylum pulchrum]